MTDGLAQIQARAEVFRLIGELADEVTDSIAYTNNWIDAAGNSAEDVPALLAMVRERDAALERVRELHKPCQMFEYDDVKDAFILDEDGNKKVMETVCRGCTPDEVIEDAEDWSYDDSRAVNWPCPTIAAITATEGAE